MHPDSDRSGIRYQALYVLVQCLITSLTKCQTRYCVEPRPSVDDIKQKQSSTRGEALLGLNRKDKKIQAESAVMSNLYVRVQV